MKSFKPEVYTVKLSWSIPFGEKISVPLSGCEVSVRDDFGHTYQFYESSIPGTYNSDTSEFRGVVGRKYSLHINTNYATPTHYSYECEPIELKAVPPVDSLYFEKVLIREETPTSGAVEGCQIYLDTYDQQGDCRYYRWTYTETWKIVLPYFQVAHPICWASYNSQNTDIKSTIVLSEDRVSRHPVTFISNETDRLSERYSILVRQYSMSQDEFDYRSRIRDVTQNVGGLYDVMPSSIVGNLFCVEDPNELVLGYFSVSARTSRRIYIDETFKGLENPYIWCEEKRWPLDANIPMLNEYRWIIFYDTREGYCITTLDHNCADCTLRGTATKPDFWEDYK